MSAPSSPRRLLVWLALAGLGLAVFFGGVIGGLGVPVEGLGGALLFVGTWSSVDALHRVPVSDEESTIAPGEWRAWVGVAFAGAILGSMLGDVDAFAAQLPIGENPEVGEAGRRVGALFVAWFVLERLLRERWSGQVDADERDARIDLRASQWGRGGTAIGVLAVAVLLGFGDTARLRELSYPLLAHLLMVALVLGMFVDQAVAAGLYWRDRRAAA